ncbi:MAG: hypothetical protein ACK4ZN_13280 [Oceanibaculum sp.]
MTLAGIGDMGPMLPMLSNIREQHHAAIRKAAKGLLDYNARLLPKAARGPLDPGGKIP